MLYFQIDCNKFALLIKIETSHYAEQFQNLIGYLYLHRLVTSRKLVTGKKYMFCAGVILTMKVIQSLHYSHISQCGRW
jgi:hypothetical protein